MIQEKEYGVLLMQAFKALGEVIGDNSDYES
jgi:hypothetical protein